MSGRGAGAGSAGKWAAMDSNTAASTLAQSVCITSSCFSCSSSTVSHILVLSQTGTAFIQCCPNILLSAGICCCCCQNLVRHSHKAARCFQLPLPAHHVGSTLGSDCHCPTACTPRLVATKAGWSAWSELIGDGG